MSNVPAFALVEPTDWHFRSLGDVAEASRRANEYARRNGTLEGAEYQIEEFVRQWVLRFLIEEYAYPLEWLGERIIIEEPVRGGKSSLVRRSQSVCSDEKRPRWAEDEVTTSRQVPTTGIERGVSMHLRGKEPMAVLKKWRETGLRQQRLS